MPCARSPSFSRGYRAAQAALVVALASLGCATPAPSIARRTCDADNGGITLPPGFCAQVVADSIGAARHLVVAPNGDVFVALRNRREVKGAVIALRDTTGDGRADVRAQFAENGGSGIALRGEALYFAPDDGVLRYRLPAGSLRPSGAPDTIVSGLPATSSHTSKPIALSPAGELFVNIGSPTNSCQQQDRHPESPGLNPCPQLDTRAGIWKFDASRTGQTQADGERFATGLRNTMGLAFEPSSGVLYGVMHGRDQLLQNWPAHFDEKESAEKPSEELVGITRGDDFGWPYCFHDPEKRAMMLAPEYGGDGEATGRCAAVKEPALAFPAHWAPNDLIFYSGTQFPGKYRGGAFIAFHGSWNRAPLPQAGYKVVFVPFSGGQPAASYEVFADGFAGADMSPQGAKHRPAGLAVGRDGSLYISDDKGGRIWRVFYNP